jgi:hypothetical protein
MGPKAVLFHLAKFLLKALGISASLDYVGSAINCADFK